MMRMLARAGVVCRRLVDEVIPPFCGGGGFGVEVGDLCKEDWLVKNTFLLSIEKQINNEESKIVRSRRKEYKKGFACNAIPGGNWASIKEVREDVS